MNTTHYAQKNVLYYKNSTLQVKICRLLTVWRKQWMITVTLLWLCKICRYIWNQCVNGGSGGRWDVCYKFSMWAIGTVSNVLKQVSHAAFPQFITMSGVVAKHILHTQWGGILTEATSA